MSAEQKPGLRVAVVGSGAGGLNCTREILDRVPDAHIDVFEALPVPFGLVRYGVAPDHVKGEIMTKNFSAVLDDPRVNLYAGVQIGISITRAELTSAYDAVIWGTGATTARILGIPGEDLPGVHTGLDFFGWYTGRPGAPEVSLDGVDNAVVIGLGDVALDVLRVLLRPVDDFRETRMPSAVLHELEQHPVPHVTVLVRRGPRHTSMKTKDLVPLLNLDGVRVELDTTQLGLHASDLDDRTRDNLQALNDAAHRVVTSPRAVLRFNFWHRPVSFQPDPDAPGSAPARVGQVSAETSRLLADGTPAGTGKITEIPAQLVVSAIGTDTQQLADLPFDEHRRTIRTVSDRLAGSGDDQVAAREYVSGWAKRGDVGGFGGARRDATATIDTLLEDADAGLLSAPEPKDADELLAAHHLRAYDWHDVQRLYAEEETRGHDHGRPVERITDADEQIQVLRRH